ncbi:hypothetical protein DI09_24p290 [Mitosporidium daphniae]|uniref:Uncharacterized protein n=1 Tax=Mitosporidium daphniae TaxID=1485682 RepID=A0A098VS91_9MICR|nr:uncharacterized protein DI09_24p290 [Mitosporidium daphniae]KGG51908.1 hypothetical protein DI09_24p290 [Mitosporidium daphniae]|eukprot:XP_013238335.1 uncharacterized protein DI09_24p290 [Mitosporidium daphniae]
MYTSPIKPKNAAIENARDLILIGYIWPIAMIRASTSADDMSTIDANNATIHPEKTSSARALEMAAPRKRAAASFSGW